MAGAASRPLVLIFEPDLDTAEMYAEYFTLHDWRAETAGDGATGLAKAAALVPDAITTETWLPAVDGFRAIEILKANPKTAAIPIVVVTADVRDEQLERLTCCAAVQKKPCLPEELLEAVNQAVCRAPGAPTVDVEARAARAQQRATRIHDRLHKRPSRMASVKTTAPAVLPPPLTCPSCTALLAYDHSRFDGTSARPEQWDYLRCPNGCGLFEYRRGARRVRPA